MTTVETSLKGANEPIGPATPNAGPTLPSVVADRPIASITLSVGALDRGVDCDAAGAQR